MLRCRLCVKQAFEVVQVFDENGKQRKIAEIIAKHFWFTPRKVDPADHIICNSCWLKVYNFHKFYESVEKAHRRLLEDHLCESEEEPVIVRASKKDIEALETNTIVYMRLTLNDCNEIVLPLNTPEDAEPATGSSTEMEIVEVPNTMASTEIAPRIQVSSVGVMPQMQDSGVEVLPQIQVPSVGIVPQIEVANVGVPPQMQVPSVEAVPQMQVPSAGVVPQMQIANAGHVPRMQIANAVHVPQMQVQTQLQPQTTYTSAIAAPTEVPHLQAPAPAQFTKSMTTNGVTVEQVPRLTGTSLNPQLYNLESMCMPTPNANLIEPIVVNEPVYELIEVVQNGQVPPQSLEDDAVIIDSDSNDSSGVVQVTGVGEHKCSVSNCQQMFNSSNALNAHMQSVHMRRDKHPCSKCARVYATKLGLRRHEKTAHPKPIVVSSLLHCNICSQPFHSNTLMMQHMLAKHGATAAQPSIENNATRI